MNKLKKAFYIFLKNKYYVGIFFFILLLVLKFPILNTPYVDDEKFWYIPRSLLISQNNLNPIFRGIGIPEELKIPEERKHPWFNNSRNYITDSTHPPLFYEILAFFYFLFGYSIVLTHLIVIVISFFTLYFTYLLGRYLYNEETGFFSSFLLLFSPVFFSQAGRAYPDMLTACFGIAAIYFSLKEKTTLYLVFGSLLVLSREQGVLFIVSILIYQFIKNYKENKKVLFNRLFSYSFPLFILVFWYIYHYLKTGLFIYGQHITQTASLLSFFLNLSNLTKFLLLGQFRFLLIIVVIYFLIKNRNITLNKKLMPLILTIALVLAFFSWANIMALRHILPVFPLFFILVTNPIQEVFKKKKVFHFIFILFFILLSVKEWHSPTKFHYEENMRYLDTITTRQEALNFISNHYPNSRFWVDGYFYYDLVYPFVGYVDKPMPNVELIPTDYLHKKDSFYQARNFTKNFKKGDLIFDSQLIMHELRSDYQIIQNLNLELIKEINIYDEYMKIYKVV